MALLSSFLKPQTIRSLGLTRMLRGVRTGNQPALYTGAALALLGWLRSRPRGERELLTRKVVPLGSMVIVRHAQDGSELPTVEVVETDEVT